MANDPQVKVSMIHAMNFRANKADPWITYPTGSRVEMPRSHAVALGVQNRIVAIAAPVEPGAPERVERLPFNGAYNAKVSDILLNAGYTDFAALSKATREDLLALEGVGPAIYEDIINGLTKGGA